MNILILEDDDNRVRHFMRIFFPHQTYVTCDTTKAKEWLDKVEFDVICLDHDLSYEAQGTDNNFNVGTGLEVAEYLGENPWLSSSAQIFIHSLNGGGANRMQVAMKTRGEVPHVPFLWLKEITFN